MLEEWNELKEDFYGTNTIVTVEGGAIDFTPGVEKTIVGAKLSYDEYLDIMRASLGNYRISFQHALIERKDTIYKGTIEKFTKNKVLFKEIDVEIIYWDGTFRDREHHVWMDAKPFKDFNPGDKVEFSAEVYMYLKTGNGKIIDFALRNPTGIQQIDDYNVASDAELAIQFIDRLICETCLYGKHCNGTFCLANEEEVAAKRQNMIRMIFGDIDEAKVD